jgi:type IV pilus assembly protein PilO
MALIPEDPKQRNALMVGVLMLAVLYFGNTYLITPKREALQADQTRLEQLEDNNRRAQIIATRGGRDLEERMAVYERHVAQLEQLIPARAQVPQLLNDISMEARQTNVELNAIRPDASDPVGVYTRETFELSVIGEYHSVGRFLTNIASMPRIITPIDMDVSLQTNDQYQDSYDAPVIATFRIQTYVIPDSDEALGPQPAPGGN